MKVHFHFAHRHPVLLTLYSSPTGHFQQFCQNSVDCMSTGLFLGSSIVVVSITTFDLQTNRLESKMYDVSSFVSAPTHTHTKSTIYLH